MKDGWWVDGLMGWWVGGWTVPLTNSRTHQPPNGFTLIEMMMGTSILVIVIVALVGGFLGQSFLNANARNLTAAMNDATRVMEQIRLQNSMDREPCKSNGGFPTVVPVDAAGNQIAATWDQWLQTEDRKKTVNTKLPDSRRNALEHVAVTCQDEDGGIASSDYCRWTPAAVQQVNSGEWKAAGRGAWDGPAASNIGPPPFNPIRVTVAVGWQEGRRTMGQSGGQQEFQVLGTPPSEMVEWQQDLDNDGVIGSQAMVTTLVTCR